MFTCLIGRLADPQQQSLKYCQFVFVHVERERTGVQVPAPPCGMHVRRLAADELLSD